MEAIWARKIAPKAPLSGPSAAAQRKLVDEAIDYQGGDRVRGGKGFIEHFRLGPDNKFHDTQYQVLFPDEWRTTSAAPKPKTPAPAVTHQSGQARAAMPISRRRDRPENIGRVAGTMTPGSSPSAAAKSPTIAGSAKPGAVGRCRRANWLPGTGYFSTLAGTPAAPPPAGSSKLAQDPHFDRQRRDGRDRPHIRNLWRATHSLGTAGASGERRRTESRREPCDWESRHSVSTPVKRAGPSRQIVRQSNRQ